MNLHWFPSSQTPQTPAASQLTWNSQHLLPCICTAMYLTCLWATAHPALRGEKGNPLCFKSLVTPAGKTKWWHVEKRAWTQQLRPVLELRAQDTMQCGLAPLKAVGFTSTALTGSCLVSRDGIETRCAVTELDSTNTCPGPMVFFWQINTALQGCAFSSQGESTWPPALWVSRLSRLSNTKLNKLHEKRWRTDLLPFPALTRESLTGWPNNMTLEMHWDSKNNHLYFAIGTATYKDTRKFAWRSPKWEDRSMTQFSAVLEKIRGLTLYVKHPYCNF